MKKISIIIPCYNVENYIAQCLDSLVRQTIGISSQEIIIIDDASTDNTMTCIMQYKEQYPEHISIIPLQQNGGQANARNIGMQHISTEYFTFLDADDWMAADAYEKMLDLAYKFQCDLVQCGTCEIIEGLEPNYCYLQNPSEPFYIHSAEERKCFFDSYTLTRCIGNSIYRTNWIRDNNFKFMTFAKYEDNYWDGLIRYAFQSYCSIPDCLSYYRILEHSNSHNRNDVGHFARLDVELQKLKYYIDSGLFSTYYTDIRDLFLNNFYTNTLHIIFNKFDDIPIDQIQMMQQIVREIYPDYLEYCRESSRFINPVVTVAFNFPPEIWGKYKSAYLNWIINKEENEIAEIYINLRSNLKL